MSKFGIDIYEGDGNIDWSKTKKQVDFVILRLGWIGNKNNHTLDTRFEKYYKECRDLNIPVGVYVYNYCKSTEAVISGAKWTLEKLKGKKLQLPVYIDMEDETLKGLGKNTLTEIVYKYNETIEKAGYWAGVYANLDWFNNYLNKDKIKKKYTTWIAMYSSGTNKFKGEYDMWQNSENGTIPGINSKVDTNYMYRDLILEIKGKKNETEKKDNKFKKYYIKVTAKGLNVREKPNANSDTKIIRVLKKGEKWLIREEKNGWGRIRIGWIKLNYTKKV